MRPPILWGFSFHFVRFEFGFELLCKFWKTPWVNLHGWFWGVEPIQTTPNKFCGFVSYIKDTFCKKNWAKLANSVHSRVRKNLQTAIQGCHCQLDDQCRGPSIKEKDHRVGWLTSASLKLWIFCLKASSYCSLNMFFLNFLVRLSFLKTSTASDRRDGILIQIGMWSQQKNIFVLNSCLDALFFNDTTNWYNLCSK